MNVIDLHCDVLCKLLREPSLDFYHSPKLDVTLKRLIEAKYILQVFAIYISEDTPKTVATFLKVIDLFYSKVLVHPQLYWVKSKADLEYCIANKKIGVMLSIEGAECLEGNLFMSSIIEQLGVKAIGLTWNNQNWAAEGVLAQTGSGLSHLGKQFLNKLKRYNTIVDVSHLSVNSFNDVLLHYDGPIWASHSNCFAICPNPRNLNDIQIKMLINRQAIIGLTYVPQFISASKVVKAEQLFAHIDHLLLLGAEDYIALGSDFDGIEHYVTNLKHPVDVNAFSKQLQLRFGKVIAEKILWRNAYRFLLSHLK